MPKRKSRSGRSYANISKTFLDDSLTFHIMEEMRVAPTDDTMLSEEYICGSKRKTPLPTLTGKRSRSGFTTPEGSPLFKAVRDDFVLFRKSNHSELLGENNFSKLSDEIILHIFQWLPKTVLVKCSEVCKRWRAISYDDSLWRRFDFGKKLVKPGVLGTLLHRGVSVLRLAMSEIKSPIFTDLQFFGEQRFSYLQYLDISMATISQESLASLLSVCNSLKKLSLEHCSINDDCCRYVAQNAGLEVLNLAMCVDLTPYGLHLIALNCVKLTEWNLSWCPISSMDAFLPILPAGLTRFNISGHRDILDDKALIMIVNRCPNLIELDVSDSPLLTGTSFVVLIEKCRNLEHLHISRSYNIPTSCNHLLKGLPNFRNLEIFRTLTDEALNDLRNYLRHVKINQTLFSTIARPTTGIRRTSIWGVRVRD